MAVASDVTVDLAAVAVAACGAGYLSKENARPQTTIPRLNRETMRVAPALRTRVKVWLILYFSVNVGMRRLVPPTGSTTSPGVRAGVERPWAQTPPHPHSILNNKRAFDQVMLP